MPTNILSLVTKETDWKEPRDLHDYRDFYIDGKSFSEYIPGADKDLCTHLGWLKSNNPEWYNTPDSAKRSDPTTIAILTNQQKSDLNESRILIYGCPVDHDPMCGAITAELVETEDSFVWKNFKYENQYAEPTNAGYNEIPEFRFAKEEYLKVFREYLKEIGA